MNRVPTLAEGWFAMAFDTIKYLYKYCFSLTCVTHWLSTTTLWRSKTYCFALQKRRFCTVKAAVLQRKTYVFGKRKKKYWFSVKIFRGRRKGETVCANRRFLLATEATQRHIRAWFITFLHRKYQPIQWLSVYYICRQERGKSLPYTARPHDKKQKNIIKNSSNRIKITNFAIITKTTIKRRTEFYLIYQTPKSPKRRCSERVSTGGHH